MDGGQSSPARPLEPDRVPAGRRPAGDLPPGSTRLHASPALDTLLAPGTAAYLSGRTAAQVFGEELFGPGGNVRQALQHGDRREGWGVTLEGPGGRTHWVSLTAAPMKHVDESWCDPRVAYVVVMRAGDEARDLDLTGVSLFAGMVARSEPMKQLFRFVEQLSESDATVLVTGESGTGRELIAHAIHQHSPRSHGPFVAVNSAALPAELLESELFGHVRGAFTGAVRDREGRFERARREEAAHALGMSRTTLWRKMREYGLLDEE